MEWISVKDRLPPQDEDILCWCISHGGENTTFEGQEGYAAIDKNLGNGVFRTNAFFNAYVTHWMPLPKPPV